MLYLHDGSETQSSIWNCRFAVWNHRSITAYQELELICMKINAQHTYSPHCYINTRNHDHAYCRLLCIQDASMWMTPLLLHDGQSACACILCLELHIYVYIWDGIVTIVGDHRLPRSSSGLCMYWLNSASIEWTSHRNQIDAINKFLGITHKFWCYLGSNFCLRAMGINILIIPFCIHL